MRLRYNFREGRADFYAPHAAFPVGAPRTPVRGLFTLTIATLESKLTFRIQQTSAREPPFHIQPPGDA